MARKLATFTGAKLTRKERRELARRKNALLLAGEHLEPEPEKLRFPGPATTSLGPGAATREYVNPMPLKVSAHRATSRHIAGIYPFLADEALGTNGPALGVELNSDVLFHFTPFDTYMDAGSNGSLSTNILMIGAYRAGKSGTAKMLITRSIAWGHQAIVPSDAKGEWVAVAEAIHGSQVIKPGRDRLNPLDRGPRHHGSTDEEHERTVWERRRSVLQNLVDTIVRGERFLSQVEIAALTWALRCAIVATNDEPTIRSVAEALRTADPSTPGFRQEFKENASRLLFALERFIDGDLAGLFEDHSTVEFNEEAPLVVCDTSALWERGELAAQLTSMCTNAWIQAVISDKRSRRTRYVVKEEGWRDMRSLGQLQTYQQWLKLSRDYGVANVILLHKLSDFDVVGAEGSEERALAVSIANDIENRFIFRQPAGETRNLIDRLRMPESQARLTHNLQPGVFVAHVGRGQYVVDAFATSTPWERELFNTDKTIEAGMASFAPLPTFDDAILDELWPVES